MIQSSSKCALSSRYIGVAICGGEPSCMNIVRSTQWCCWSTGRTWLRKNTSYRLSVTVQVTEPARVASSKKKSLTWNATVIPHHTMTFSDCRGNGCSWNGFSVTYVLHFWVFTEFCQRKWTLSDYRMFHGHPLSTSIRARNCNAKKLRASRYQVHMIYLVRVTAKKDWQAYPAFCQIPLHCWFPHHYSSILVIL